VNEVEEVPEDDDPVVHKSDVVQSEDVPDADQDEDPDDSRGDVKSKAEGEGEQPLVPEDPGSSKVESHESKVESHVRQQDRGLLPSP
jgi:hypothetical protein